jgi:biopolymer transport protein ExbD
MAAKLSGTGGGKFSIEQNAEINVTPFVDVMLVLLIIFMVAAPLASVTVKLALPPAVAIPTPNPPKPIYISIQKNGNLYVGDYKTDLSTLGADIKKDLTRRDPTKERIFIRADKDTMYGDFMGVMSKLQDEGFYSVALIGTDQRGGAASSDAEN